MEIGGGGVAAGWGNGNSDEDDDASFDSYEEVQEQTNLEKDATKRLKEIKFQTRTRLQIEEEHFQQQVSDPDVIRQPRLKNSQRDKTVPKTKSIGQPAPDFKNLSMMQKKLVLLHI